MNQQKTTEKDENMRKTYIRQVLVVPGLMLMLAGSAMAAEPSGAEGIYGGTLNQCRTELTLLKSLDLSRYRQEEKALNGDLASAARYLLMRDRLSAEMQETLDRLHQANLTRSCQQIHNELFSQLLNKSVIAVSPGGRGV